MLSCRGASKPTRTLTKVFPLRAIRLHRPRRRLVWPKPSRVRNLWSERSSGTGLGHYYLVPFSSRGSHAFFSFFRISEAVLGPLPQLLFFLLRTQVGMQMQTICQMGSARA